MDSTVSRAQAGVAVPERDVATNLRRELQLRLVIAGLLTLGSLSALVGLMWDIQWHTDVGRDTFFIPPHLLIYTGTTLAGLLCLGFVLYQTYRYYHHDPVVNDGNTTPLFGYFHAPLGFMVAGFGVLATITAAPLDDYWHQLYGIDVEIFAPFHFMGILGMIVTGFGTLYAYASISNQLEQDGQPVRRWLGLTGPQWGLVVQASISLSFMSVVLVSVPGLGDFFYGAVVPFLVVSLMLACLRLTERVGTATLIGVIYTLLRLLLEVFVPWAVNALVASLGQSYREGEASLNSTNFALPTLPLVAGLVLDGVYLWARQRAGFRWGSYRLALVAGVLAALTLALLEPIWLFTVVFGLTSVEQFAQEGVELSTFLLFFILPALVITPLATWLGMSLGASLKVTKE